MPEQKEPPRPHGDPLDEVVDRGNVEQNAAQRQSDATDDAASLGGRRGADGRNDLGRQRNSRGRRS